MAASAATFKRLVGHQPGELVAPPLTKTLPRSLEQALATAEKQNPNILAASYAEISAIAGVEVAKGDLLPSVFVEARATQRWNNLNSVAEGGGTETQDLTIRGVVDVPLYEQGRVYSGVRQQKQLASQRRIDVVETRRAVAEAVTQSWAFLDAARETITSAKAQVAATALALDGVRQEYLVGSRTTLDVLNAESELTDANVNLVSAERDTVVAAYQVVASTGNLTARNLKLNVEHYDSHANQRVVRKKWIGLEADTID